MIGLGTIINVVLILLGGILGMLFGRRMTERYQDTLMKSQGLCLLFVGIGGAMNKCCRYRTASCPAAEPL